MESDGIIQLWDFVVLAFVLAIIIISALWLLLSELLMPRCSRFLIFQSASLIDPKNNKWIINAVDENGNMQTFKGNSDGWYYVITDQRVEGYLETLVQEIYEQYQNAHMTEGNLQEA